MFMGMRWGAALMDPSSRALGTERIARGEPDAKYAGWPQTWDDPAVNKGVVLMSDGMNTRLQAINPAVHARYTPAWWNANDPPDASRYTRVNSAQGDNLLDDICTAVKDRADNVLVYAIGFEVSGVPEAQAALSKCASSLSTYYLVEGVEIPTAFKDIADEIANLKLTH